MSVSRQVVITGVGVVSPIGIGRITFWESLRAGHSGVKVASQLSHCSAPVRIGGEITDFDGKQFVTPRKSLKVMSREIQLGFAAAGLAITDSHLDLATVDRNRFGVVYGGELLYSVPEELRELFGNCMVDGEFDFNRWGERMANDLFPLWMLKYLPNMPACHIAIAHDARGPINSIVHGDVSSLLAVMEAARCIERGHADVMITGGSGSRLNLTAFLFRGDKDLSHRNDAPAEAVRPFDRNRDGMVNGEGAGALILESAQHAAARGATVLARLAGFGSAFEAAPPRGSMRTGRGIQLSIRQALREGQRTPEEVGHVNANGLSTVREDQVEAGAIRAELGDVPVMAPKSYFGSLGAGTGAVELAATVLALAHGEIPSSLNYTTPDPLCPVHVIHGAPLRGQPACAVVLNQDVEGQAVAALLTRP